MQKINVVNKEYIEFKRRRSCADDKDYLTGLPNRRALYAFYEGILPTETVSVMFIDVDNFKRTNDVYGHAVGADLLRAVSNYLSTSFPDATIYRLGGDEFVAMIRGVCDDQELLKSVQQVSDGLQCIDFRRDVLSFISFSIGIVVNQPACLSLDDILNRCDKALYHAKENVKNMCVFYTLL